MERKKVIFLFVGVLVILLLVVELITFYLLRRKDIGLEPDLQSIQRNQTINVILSSYFGNNWQVVLSGFLLLILFIIVLFYIISKKEITISGESKTYKYMNVAAILFFGILSVGVLYAAYNMYSDIKSKTVSSSDNAKIINQQKQELVQLFLVITGLVLLILVLVGGGLWGIRKLRSKIAKAK